jgi:hypothetical protein
VSLLLRRRAIARAVIGDLSPVNEARLRVHLRGCAACRGFYDELSRAAEAAVPNPGSSTRAASRASERLARALGSLGPAATVSGTTTATTTVTAAVGTRARTARWQRWLIAGAVLAPAAVLVVWLGHGLSLQTTAGPESASEILWRGPDEDAGRGPALVVYASRRDGSGGRAPVRLVGELPGSGTLRVSRADYLQFGVSGLPRPALVSIAARTASGTVHVFLPRAGTTAPTAAAGSAPSVVGPSFDLAREPGPGKYAVTARLAPAAGIDADGGAMDAVATSVSGFLIIEP